MQHKQEYQLKYQKNNPDKIKQYGLMHQNHKITKSEWESCKQYFEYKCAYCGLPIDEHWTTYREKRKLGDFHKEHPDHNGANDLSNCIPSCESCNCQKNDKKFDNWYNEINPIYSIERLDKIIQWLEIDYKHFTEVNFDYN